MQLPCRTTLRERAEELGGAESYLIDELVDFVKGRRGILHKGTDRGAAASHSDAALCLPLALPH
jgi:hypothetical protein